MTTERYPSSPEAFPNPENSPNQPFHDLLHKFAQAILRAAQESMNSMGVAAYPLDTQIEYERKFDELLADWDKKQGEQRLPPG